MNTKKNQNIKTIRLTISKKLNKEIEYALKNLKLNEQKKGQGATKHKWTKIEASDKLGSWLKTQRRKIKM